MTTLTTATPGSPLALTSRRLARRWFVLIPVGCALFSLLVFAISPLQGRADFVIFFAVTYVIVQTVVSALVEGRRWAVDRFVLTLVVASFVAAVAPLLAVLGLTIARGAARFDVTFFTHSMNGLAESDPGGGAYHAILGTLEQVGLATLIAVPFGLLVAIYLVEYAPARSARFGRLVSFIVDVMTGVPSIVAGLFVLAFYVLVVQSGAYSGFAGSLALTILMLPTVIRSSEEMLKLVPPTLREGGLALGLSKARVTLRVVLPSALPGIVTGVMLAIARVAGESAPLLLTIFGASAINPNPFSGPQAGLPLFVFNEAGNNNQAAIDRAWTGALTLILIVMLLNLVARLGVRLASRKRADRR